jgi:carotenoid cleavage dioxygenase-like enzyme
MVNRFELNPVDAPGQVCYTSVWMNTKVHQAMEKDPSEPPRGILFEDTVPPRKGCLLNMCDLEAVNDNMWVNSMVIGGEAVWLSDVPRMLSMDLESLDVKGFKTWADDGQMMGLPQPDWVLPDHMASLGSAHPVKRPGTEIVVEVLSEMQLGLGSGYTDIYTFDASVKGNQSRQRQARIKEDDPQYFHSFGVTSNKVVLIYDMASDIHITGKPLLSDAFRPSWKGVHVHDSLGGVQVFDDMEPFMHVHIANTFENATGVVMDLGAYTVCPFAPAVMDIAMSLNKTLRDSMPNSLRAQMRRYHLNNVTGKTTVENLTVEGKAYDFVKVSPAVEGRPHCVYYAVEWFHNMKEYGSMAIMKHDVCAGRKSYWNRPNTYVNEPFFVANDSPSREDDGVLIFTANDGNIGKAIFVVLDGTSFQELDRVELPNHIPFTAHGNFIPRPAQPRQVVV